MAKKVRIKNKTRRTMTELQQASKHLFWGMRYLSQRFEFLLRYIGSKQEDEMGGIIVSINDSFLIHARKLIEFLYNESLDLYDDDVVAEDYFDDPYLWRNLRPKQSDLIQKTKADIGKLLAHFTYKVVNHADGRVTWNVSEVYVEIFRALQIFLKEAPASFLNKDLDMLREENPGIVICHPVYSSVGEAPYQIQCVRDKASGVEIVEN